MAGTFDIWEWYCGCPPSPGGSCQGDVWPAGDGLFYNNVTVKFAGITDGTSNTIAVGEFARFKNDPDSNFNEWSRALDFAVGGRQYDPPGGPGFERCPHQRAVSGRQHRRTLFSG